MDRDIRAPVTGTWARRPLPAGDALVRDRDPRGWRAHHGAYAHAHARAADEPGRLEAIRARAFDIYLERLKWGWSGTAQADWLAAERDVMHERD